MHAVGKRQQTNLLRVPVAVEEDHRVSNGEVEADAARARRQQEDKGGLGCRSGATAATAARSGSAGGSREVRHGLETLLAAHAAIQPLVAVSEVGEDVLRDIEALDAGAEEQDAPSQALEHAEELNEQDELARGFVDVGPFTKRLGLHAGDGVGMRGALAQGLDDVDQGAGARNPGP